MRFGGQLVVVGTIMTLALAATIRSGEAVGKKAGEVTAPDRYRAHAPAGRAATSGGGSALAGAGAAVAIAGVGPGGAAWARRLNGRLSGKLGDSTGWATVNGAAEILPTAPLRTLLRIRWSVAGRGGMADCGTTTVSAAEANAVLAELGDVFGAATRRSGAMGAAVCG